MGILRTSGCTQFGHSEFRLQIDESAVIDVDRRFALKWLESQVANGVRFSHGQTVQLGWSLLQVRANADQTLSLLEPEFASRPISWVDSITSSLRHLRLHKDTCESFFDPEQLSCPGLQHSGIVCARYEDAADFMMTRSEVDGRDSGWFMGCQDDDHDHNDVSELESISLYEAVLRNPEVLPYLALPSGVFVASIGGVPAVFFAEQRVSPRPGSMVERLLSTRLA